MSGHSKWHNIQKTKGAADAKRAQAFTKIAREIIVAVKEGGSGDPANNSRLATVIAKAKAANMPNDNIKRTITDNRNRTASEVRHHFDKYGGNLGATGCVSWSFDEKGVIVVDNEDEEIDEDTIMLSALEAGADDVKTEEGVYEIYTSPDVFSAVNDALAAEGYHFLSAQIEMVPQNYIKLTDPEDIKNMEKMIEMFEDNDDVQNVWHNWDEE